LRNECADYDALAASAFDPRDPGGRNCMAQPLSPFIQRTGNRRLPDDGVARTCAASPE